MKRMNRRSKKKTQSLRIKEKQSDQSTQSTNQYRGKCAELFRKNDNQMSLGIYWFDDFFKIIFRHCIEHAFVGLLSNTRSLASFRGPIEVPKCGSFVLFDFHSFRWCSLVVSRACVCVCEFCWQFFLFEFFYFFAWRLKKIE